MNTLKKLGFVFASAFVLTIFTPTIGLVKEESCMSECEKLLIKEKPKENNKTEKSKPRVKPHRAAPILPSQNPADYPPRVSNPEERGLPNFDGCNGGQSCEGWRWNEYMDEMRKHLDSVDKRNKEIEEYEKNKKP